jgi:hypothetical protein
MTYDLVMTRRCFFQALAASALAAGAVLPDGLAEAHQTNDGDGLVLVTTQWEMIFEDQIYQVLQQDMVPGFSNGFPLPPESTSVLITPPALPA